MVSSGPQSHLHPHSQPLSAKFQTTDKGRAAAEAHYNEGNPSSANNMAPTAKDLTLESTLPVLNSSYTMPRLGFGLYQSPPSVCMQSCLTALKAGYRHIDSAQFYANEKEMGDAVRQSGIPRSEVFMTTKILSAGGSLEKTYQKCLESVRKIDDGPEGYVDLFLIHSPNCGPSARKEMWLALERLVEERRVRSIGVSNFGIGHIEEMKEYARIWPPVVNQIELHPFTQQRAIVSYCHTHNIIIQAYAPLVRNLKANHETLITISKAHAVTTGHILIRYCLQKGWVPLPKSDTPERIVANKEVYGFELTEVEMGELDALDQGERGAVVQVVRND